MSSPHKPVCNAKSLARNFSWILCAFVIPALSQAQSIQDIIVALEERHTVLEARWEQMHEDAIYLVEAAKEMSNTSYAKVVDEGAVHKALYDLYLDTIPSDVPEPEVPKLDTSAYYEAVAEWREAVSVS